MRAFSLVTIVAVLLTLGCEAKVSMKTTDSSSGQAQSSTTIESDSDTTAEATYTSNRSEANAKPSETKPDQGESPTAKNALAKALSAVKADDKNLLVHFGAPG